MVTVSTGPAPDPGLPTADREELLSRRIEESAVRRIQWHFSIFGVAVALLVAVGVVGFAKYLQSSLSDIVASAVNVAADRQTKTVATSLSQQMQLELNRSQLEIKHATDSMTKVVDKGLSNVNRRFETIESSIEDTRRRADRTALETEVNLKNTVAQVERTGKLLLADIEERRANIASQLATEFRRLEKARQDFERDAERSADNIRSQLASLERLTTAVRAPLSGKLLILKGLALEPNAPDADVQRSLAILVLKELEDTELVAQERLYAQARDVVEDFITRPTLIDASASEIRLRLLRVAAALDLKDAAKRQANDRRSWDRSGWIALTGSIGNRDVLPDLLSLLTNKVEQSDIREAAAGAIGQMARRRRSPFLKISRVFANFEVRVYSELGIVQTARSRTTRLAEQLTKEDQALIGDAAARVGFDRSEPLSLRKSSLMLLRDVAIEKHLGEIEHILRTELASLGNDAIAILEQGQTKRSLDLLADLASRDDVSTTIRRRAVEGLEKANAIETLKALRVRPLGPELMKLVEETINRLTSRGNGGGG